jgi:xanthine/CO dehydrogenase XdhC/CoxF family maturation factor/cation diffusion facilitator CzcD-associated flavoprotein CzcO
VRDVVEAISQVLASGRPAALATVVRVSGSVPQQAGARLLLLSDGTRVGTVGGGAFEQDIVRVLQETLETGRAQLLTRELGHDLAMCCGGRMEVFVEQIAVTPRLVLLGAGHVAKPTAALARSVGFEVLVIDDREELLTAERFPDCTLELRDPVSSLRRSALTDRDWVLITTHDHQLDQHALSLALQQEPHYIGMIGSTRKVFRLLQRSAALGHARELERVYAPVGLDLGALGPEEIAVSIVAELIALRRGRPAPHLRAVDDPRLRRTLDRAAPTEAGTPRPLETRATTAETTRRERRLELVADATAGAAADSGWPGADRVARAGESHAAVSGEPHADRVAGAGEPPAAVSGEPQVALSDKISSGPPAAISGEPGSAPRAALAGLRALEHSVQRDLDLLDYPRREWVERRKGSGGAPIYDVIIVGAGQSGLSAGFGLMRERVKNLLLIDRNRLDCAGPWLDFARMRTLRTPKHLTGPDLGIPSLTPRNWYEAQYGVGSWETLGLIPKETWAAYLAWYRATLEIPVQPETEVGALRWEPNENAFLVPTSRGGEQQILLARRVVLASGIDGSGHWQIPKLISDALPASRYAHTRFPIDFAALRGKRIAVLGAGASAFDNASTALEVGAAEIHLYFRRPKLVDVNPYRWAEFVGFLAHLGDLPDADKWRFIAQIQRMGQLPPADTLARARTHPGFHLHPSSGWRKLEMRGDEIVIHTEHEQRAFDFVIVGTGFVTDLGARPELSQLAPVIARWSDRYQPPPEDENADLLRHPYLGPHFEFSERTPGSAPYLKYLYNYTFGCLLSLGFGGASISGLKYSIPRLVSGVTGSLFVEDRVNHFASLRDFALKEFEAPAS